MYLFPKVCFASVSAVARCCLTINLFSILLALSLSACGQAPEDPEDKSQSQIDPNDFKLSLVSSSPHSTEHFTQGLFFFNDSLYESIGQYGQSALIKYGADRQTISVKRQLEDNYFAEGADVLNERIYQLTWKAGKSFVYQGPMLTASEGFNYEGDGWGLASDGEFLWMSNGSHQIKKLSSDGEILKTIDVLINEQPVNNLNELEWINGWLLANRWYDNLIFIIDPETGSVVRAFNLASIATPELQKNRNNVLNGIAWDANNELLWITGKNWANFYQFQIQLPDKN